MDCGLVIKRFEQVGGGRFFTESIKCNTCHICNYMANIKYSRHARSRMVERGISTKEVNDAIQKGTKKIQGKRIVTAYRHIEVVFRKVKDDCYVITVMLRW